MEVFRSSETSYVAQTGKLHMHQQGEKILGSHTVLIVGYDDIKQALINQNIYIKIY